MASDKVIIAWVNSILEKQDDPTRVSELGVEINDGHVLWMILRYYLSENPAFEFKKQPIRPRSDRLKTTNIAECIGVLNSLSSVKVNVEADKIVAVDREAIDTVFDAVIRGVAFPTSQLVELLNASAPADVPKANHLESAEIQDGKLLAALAGKFIDSGDHRAVAKEALSGVKTAQAIVDGVENIADLSSAARHVIVGSVALAAGKIKAPKVVAAAADSTAPAEPSTTDADEGPSAAELQKSIDEKKFLLAAAAGEFGREKNASLDAAIDAEVASLREKRQQQREERQKLTEELATIEKRLAGVRQMIETERSTKRAKVQAAKDEITKEVEELTLAVSNAQKSVDSTQEELKKLESELEQTRSSENGASDESGKALEAEVAQLRNKKDQELSPKLAESKKLQAELSARLSDVKSKLESTKAAAASATAAASVAAEKLQEEKKTLSEQINSLEEEIKTASASVQDLQAQTEAETKALEEARASSDAAKQAEVSNLTKEIEDIKAQLSEKTTQLQAQRSKQAELKAEIQKIKDGASTNGSEDPATTVLSAEKQELKQKVDAARVEFEAAQASVRDLEAQLAQETQTHEAARANAAQQQQKAADELRNELNLLKEEIASVSSKVGAEKDKQFSLAARMAELKSVSDASSDPEELKNLTEERSSLQAKITDLAAELESATKASAEAEKKLEEYKDSSENAKKETESLRAQLQSLREKEMSLQKEIESKKAAAASAAHSESSLSAEASELQVQVQKLKSEAEEKRKSISDAEKILKALEIELANVQPGGSAAQLVDELKQERQQLETDQINLQNRRDVVIASLEQTRARAEKEKKEHDERLRAIQKENATARSNLSSLQTQLNKLESELAAANAAASESSTSSDDKRHSAAVAAFQEQINTELALQKTLEAEIKKAQTRAKQIEGQVNEANERRKELNRAAKDASREIEARAAAQTAEIERLRKEIQTKMRHTQNLRDQEALATASVEDLRGRLKGQKDVARKLDSHLQQLGIRKVELPKELDQQISSLKAEAAAAEKENTQVHASVSSKKQQEAEIQKQLTQTVNENALKSHVLEKAKTPAKKSQEQPAKTVKFTEAVVTPAPAVASSTSTTESKEDKKKAQKKKQKAKKTAVVNDSASEEASSSSSASTVASAAVVAPVAAETKAPAETQETQDVKLRKGKKQAQTPKTSGKQQAQGVGEHKSPQIVGSASATIEVYKARAAAETGDGTDYARYVILLVATLACVLLSVGYVHRQN